MTVTRKYFGTDGVRHRANSGPLAPDKIMTLGLAAGQYFGQQAGRPVTAMIGRDTRLSGHMVEAALVAGLTSVGVSVQLCGIIPTPAVALSVRNTDADFGIMITASHNPFEDNGIKFFNAQGGKLSDADEADIENLMFEKSALLQVEPPQIGSVDTYEDAFEAYIDHAVKTVTPETDFSGLNIVLDCANGAAFETAPEILSRLGVGKIFTIGVSPDGQNINKDCGSTRPDLLSRTVVDRRADLGIALDGDADRLIMCDETGRVIDGDQLLGLIAKGWSAKDRLSRPGIVATVMSNLGLERYLATLGLTLERTAVGDRHVSARMKEAGYNAGGEQSGHMLLTDFSPAGDGLIAALHVLCEILEAGQAASEVLNVFTPVPQLLKNVRYKGASPLSQPRVIAALDKAREEMGTSGRILVRASGTEPVIRVMAEGDDEKQVATVVEGLINIIDQT